jgi:hypothetical protein
MARTLLTAYIPVMLPESDIGFIVSEKFWCLGGIIKAKRTGDT